MKLYLAGPMRGIKDFNFPAFHAAAASLRAMGHDVFSPAEKDIEQHGKNVFKSADGNQETLERKTSFNLRDALGMDLSYICGHADGVALLCDWEKSAGARAESATAVALGLRRFIQLPGFDLSLAWAEAWAEIDKNGLVTGDWLQKEGTAS